MINLKEFRPWTDADDKAEFERANTLMLLPMSVFVFGSNLAGIHGAGAARFAKDAYGAKWGQGEGLSRRSYAIPTKDAKIETLPLWAIQQYVQDFRTFARLAPSVRFVVTRIGCGLAGYRDEQIAPMFGGCTDNVKLPFVWTEMLYGRKDGE